MPQLFFLSPASRVSKVTIKFHQIWHAVSLIEYTFFYMNMKFISNSRNLKHILIKTPVIPKLVSQRYLCYLRMQKASDIILTAIVTLRLCSDNFDFVHLEIAGVPLALGALVLVLMKPQYKICPIILAVISILFSGVLVYYSIELSTCTGE